MAVSSDYFSEDIVGFVSANFSLEVEQPSNKDNWIELDFIHKSEFNPGAVKIHSLPD